MTAPRRSLNGSIFGLALLAMASTAAPALGQNSGTPVAVTAAPPASTETVGPSQLRDFSLQGTVTRPAEQPAAGQGRTSPTTAPAAPRAGEAVPAEAAAPPTDPGARRATTASPPRMALTPAGGGEPAGLPQSGTPVTPSLPLEVNTDPAPQPGVLTTTPQASLDEGAGMGWPWVLALLALVSGGGYLAYSRRSRAERQADPGRLAFAGLAPDQVPDSKPFPPARPNLGQAPAGSQPAPQPDPVPSRPKPTAPTPPTPPSAAEEGLIVSTLLKPDLRAQLIPDRVVISDRDIALQFDILLNNLGSAPAREVLVEGRLVSASANQDREIAAFFEQPAGPGDRIAAIPPLGRIALKSAVRLPLDLVHHFEVEGRRLCVLLAAFNVLYRTGGREERISASFLIGRGSDEDRKLAPFRLDLGPRIFRGLSARPHSLGLQPA